jgi:hypothetical protein
MFAPPGEDVFAVLGEDVFAVLGRDVTRKDGDDGAVPDSALGGYNIGRGSLVCRAEGSAFDVLGLFDVWGDGGMLEGTVYWRKDIGLEDVDAVLREGPAYRVREGLVVWTCCKCIQRQQRQRKIH